MFGSVVAQGQRGMSKTVARREQRARGREQGVRGKEQRANSEERAGDRGQRTEVRRQKSEDRGQRSEKNRIPNGTHRTTYRGKGVEFAQSLERRKDKADGREEKNVERAFGPLGSGIGSRFHWSLRRILAQQLSTTSTGGETARSNPGSTRANLARGD